MNDESLASFLDKFRARWPEWAIAEAFVPPAQRPVALAWFSLLQELTDAAWGGSDPRPGEAKLGWWQEELAGWSRGARRHPLGQALQGQPAPWATLAQALPVLAASRERARDVEEAFAMLAPFSSTVMAVESELFGGAVAEPVRETVSASLLHSRFLQPGDVPVPLTVLAQAGEGDEAARRQLWAAQLRSQWPRPVGSRARRIRAGLARARLERGDPGRPLPAWKALLIAWRAARG